MIRLKQLFRRPSREPAPEPEPETCSEAELEAIERRVLTLYRSNMATLIDHDESIVLLTSSPDYEPFKDLFLWGMVAAWVTGRPPHPDDLTDGAVRAFVCSLVQLEGLSLRHAEERAELANAAFEQGHPVIDGFVEAGGLALMTKRSDCLLLAHERLPSDFLRD